MADRPSLKHLADTFLLFYFLIFLLAALHNLQDLSSPIRSWTQVTAVKLSILTTRTMWSRSSLLHQDPSWWEPPPSWTLPSLCQGKRNKVNWALVFNRLALEGEAQSFLSCTIVLRKTDGCAWLQNTLNIFHTLKNENWNMVNSPNVPQNALKNS